jgi:beta-glucosidase
MTRSFSIRTLSSLMTRFLVIGLVFLAAGCDYATRRVRLNGTGGSGQGGSTGTGGSSATPIHGELPEEILPPGSTGMGGAPPKMACADMGNYTLSYSPGYSDAEHQNYTMQAQAISSRMNLTQKADQLRGVFSGEGASNWEDIQRSYDLDEGGLRVKGWQYRDGPRGLNIDQPVFEGNKAAGVGQKVAEHGNATAFPVEVARGATFDVGLEYRIGMAMGDELVAANFSMFLVPCVNILRHPFWGRAQETYGEDSFHLGRVGTGLTAGIQEYAAACAKHWAANNIERQRWVVNSNLEPRTLRETYGRHFEMIVQDGGTACIMAAYNMVNGLKATQNKELLTTILRNEFGFKGLILSDWWAMPGYSESNLGTPERTNSAKDALLAGLDIEVPWSLNYKVIDEGLLTSGTGITEPLITEHVDRVLAQKIRFKSHLIDQRPGLKAPNSTYAVSGGTSNIINNDAHIAIAEEAARKSMVLLKNCPSSDKTCAAPAADGNVLPIAPSTTSAPKKIAVVGPTISYCMDGTGPGIQFCNQDATNHGTINFATGIRTGDTGSSRVNVDLERSVSPFAGICKEAGGTVDRNVAPTSCSGSSTFTVTTGTTSGGDVTPAVNVARDADVVVVVVGLTPYNEGEEYNGNDRQSLSLDGKDHGRGYGQLNTNLINAIADLGKPTIVVIEAGSVVELAPWIDKVSAVVMAWYPGMVGGTALGKLLLGKENFSGKLPVTWPMSESQYPTFDEMPSGTTNMGYFLGYRRFDAENLTPRYPFGHGLSYSTFQYGNLQVPCSSSTKNGVIEVKVDVANTSPRGGEEVVMLFVSFPTGPTDTLFRSKKELKGFYRVGLDGMGQTADCKYGSGSNMCASTKRITIPVRVRDLKYFDMSVTPNRWDVQPGQYKIIVAPNAGVANKALQSTPELCPAAGGVGCALSDTFTVVN